MEESEESSTEEGAEQDWVECSSQEEVPGEEEERRRRGEEEERRSLDRQSSIVSSVSSLLWGLAQSPKSPKK